MGRKPRATKPQIFEPTPTLKSQPKVPTSAGGGTFVKKKLKTPTAMLRRSPRIQSTVCNQELETVCDQELETVIEEIVIIGSQKDDEQLLHEENKSAEEASDLNISEAESSSKKDDPGVADLKYKAMYRCSQTKIEGLIEENRQLSKALEFANGKIHVYEKQSNLYSEVMTTIASLLSRANENISALKHSLPDGDNEEFERLVTKKQKNV